MTERTQTICSVEQCDRRAKARGFCATHYDRWRETGTTGGGIARRTPQGETRLCAVDGCERQYRSGGYCGLHYDRVRSYGTPDLPERPERVCQVDTCGRKLYGLGYCAAHWKRLVVDGDVRADVPLRKVPTADERDDIASRILDKCVTTERGCIEWRGYCIPSDYGTISWRGRCWVVHRAMWTVKVGPIPTDDDWTLDHLRFNRRCVNAQHLEVVTRIENSRRGGGLDRAIAANKILYIDECRNGHARTPENTSIRGGQRHCLQCSRDGYARRAERVNAALRERYAERRAQGIDWREARLA